MACNDTIMHDIITSCENPIIGGYTGRAVLIPYKDAPVIVRDSVNNRKVKSITPAEGAKFVAVNNVFADPFTGSNTAGNVDAGRPMYVKTIAIRIPRRGADISKDLVEAMANDAQGYLLVAEKKDKTQDGGFEVIGLQTALRPDVTTIARTESENGGDIVVNLTTTESFFECTFVGSGSDYETALEEFNELYANTIGA